MSGLRWQQIEPNVVVDARQVDPVTTIATLSTYSSTLIVSSASAPIPLSGSLIGMAAPLPRAGNLALTLRLGMSPCRRSALAADPPPFFDAATVTTYACRDGYAYAAYAQGSGPAKVTRGQVLAAIGTGWHAVAAGTAWDGRILAQDLRYAGLDVTAFQDRFPQTKEPVSYTAPDMSGLVGSWTKERDYAGSGRLVITSDAHGHINYQDGSGPEYHVTLLFIRSTTNTAMALATVTDDPNVRIGSRFYFEINSTSPRSLWVHKPYGYADSYIENGTT